MGKMHIWVGRFESRKSFEKYLDQKAYLEAWAAYDHGAPADDEDNQEPDPALRCAFCKEVDLEDYDEDALVMRYFQKAVGADRMAKDIPAGESQLQALFDKHGLDKANALIAYEAKGLSKKSASRSASVRYLGQIEPHSGDAEASARHVHHLWVGRRPLDVDKARIVEHIGIARAEIVGVTFSRSDEARRLDATLAIQVEDFSVAEKMILAIDDMKLAPTAYAVLNVILDARVQIAGDTIGSALGMRYIGKFFSD